MACELARYRVAVRVIDKRADFDPHCRTTSLHARTLEIFNDPGIVDVILAQSVKLRGISQYAKGERFMALDLRRPRQPVSIGISIEQRKIESALEHLLNSYGVEVERETEFLTFAQDAEKVIATIRRRDRREEEVTTPWLIGCDGARSRVRHVNRLHFPGTEDPHQYFVSDVRLDCPLARDKVGTFVSDSGASFVIPLPDDRWLVGGDVDTMHDAATE